MFTLNGLIFTSIESASLCSRDCLVHLIAKIPCKMLVILYIRIDVLMCMHFQMGLNFYVE